MQYSQENYLKNIIKFNNVKTIKQNIYYNYFIIY